MRVIMMGTGPFAVPTLEALYHSAHEVPLLVTRPARPLHRKSDADANPMRALAEARGTPVFDPESVNAPAAREQLAARRPDLLVVCDYGQILRPETLAVAPLGGVNLHASLLPKFRGAAPINWAIYHGQTETGVSVLHMTPQVDAGPVIAQAPLAIGPDDTAADLEPRLAALGAPLVLESLAALAAGTARAIEQDPTQATRAPRLSKSDGAIDWRRTAAQIKNQVRAMQPWPKSSTHWQRPDGPPLRLILERVDALPAASSAVPGTVLEAAGERLLVAAGAGTLAIHQLQPAGKRVLATAEFLRGYPVRSGQRFE